MTNNPTTDGVSRLPPCDQTVYKDGVSCGLFDIPKGTAENICQNISTATGCKVDWHYIGGRVHIKALPSFELTALQSRIDQLEAEAVYAAAGYQAARARIKELESGRGEIIHQVRTHGSDCWEDMSGESLELCQCDPEEYEIRKLFTAPPAPVSVVLPSSQELHILISKAARQADLTTGANYFTAAEFAAIAVNDATTALNGVKS